jgi:hypothetical protein
MQRISKREKLERLQDRKDIMYLVDLHVGKGHLVASLPKRTRERIKSRYERMSDSYQDALFLEYGILPMQVHLELCLEVKRGEISSKDRKSRERELVARCKLQLSKYL